MSKKLLLADDSITIQKVIQITFAHEDYDLTITDNGDTAFARVQEINPDLVIADVYMPGKNGYDLAAAIKQDPALQHTPVLLLAGSFEPFDEDKARACRADAWIEKPFESQTLIDKVSELLEAATAPVQAPEPASAAAPAPAVSAPPASVPAEPAMEDPFADISFEEEPAAVEPVAAAPAEDDWSDVGLSLEEPVASEPVSAAPPFEEAEFSFDDESPALEVEDFSFAEPMTEPETAAGVLEEFTFEEELPATADDMTGAVAAGQPEPQADDFDFGGFDDIDEVMPLGEDDILEAEDLEPAPIEPTLSTWSREVADDDELFETAASDDLPGELPPLQEELREAPDFESELPELVAAEAAIEPVAAAEQVVTAAAEPAGASAVGLPSGAEQQVAALSEADLEAIVEKVAGRIIEKLAGTVLERVAWEVVPDLAENLVREEIRKIREAAA